MIAAQHLRAARRHLQAHDAILKQLLRELGPCQIRVTREPTGLLEWFRLAVDDVESQGNGLDEPTSQVSVSSPDSDPSESLRSVDDLCPPGKGLILQGALDCPAGDSRSLGNAGKWSEMSNQQIVQELQRNRGMDQWSCDLFLIFGLGRLDVLPVNDRDLRVSVSRHYPNENALTASGLVELAAAWHPYASIATWYLWASIDATASQGRWYSV